MNFACVTLSFNQGKYLSEAIDSIVIQNKITDYVVYDAGSSDDSRKVILEYDSRDVKPCFVDGDLGPADGLNNGLGKAQGDIF